MTAILITHNESGTILTQPHRVTGIGVTPNEVVSYGKTEHGIQLIVRKAGADPDVILLFDTVVAKQLLKDLADILSDDPAAATPVLDACYDGSDCSGVGG